MTARYEKPETGAVKRKMAAGHVKREMPADQRPRLKTNDGAELI